MERPSPHTGQQALGTKLWYHSTALTALIGTQPGQSNLRALSSSLSALAEWPDDVGISDVDLLSLIPQDLRQPSTPHSPQLDPRGTADAPQLAPDYGSQDPSVAPPVSLPSSPTIIVADQLDLFKQKLTYCSKRKPPFLKTPKANRGTESATEELEFVLLRDKIKDLSLKLRPTKVGKHVFPIEDKVAWLCAPGLLPDGICYCALQEVKSKTEWHIYPPGVTLSLQKGRENAQSEVKPGGQGIWFGYVLLNTDGEPIHYGVGRCQIPSDALAAEGVKLAPKKEAELPSDKVAQKARWVVALATAQAMPCDGDQQLLDLVLRVPGSAASLPPVMATNPQPTPMPAALSSSLAAETLEIPFQFRAPYKVVEAIVESLYPAHLPEQRKSWFKPIDKCFSQHLNSVFREWENPDLCPSPEAVSHWVLPLRSIVLDLTLWLGARTRCSGCSSFFFVRLQSYHYDHARKVGYGGGTKIPHQVPGDSEVPSGLLPTCSKEKLAPYVPSIAGLRFATLTACSLCLATKLEGGQLVDECQCRVELHLSASSAIWRCAFSLTSSVQCTHTSEARSHRGALYTPATRQRVQLSERSRRGHQPAYPWANCAGKPSLLVRTSSPGLRLEVVCHANRPGHQRWAIALPVPVK